MDFSNIERGPRRRECFVGMLGEFLRESFDFSKQQSCSKDGGGACLRESAVRRLAEDVNLRQAISFASACWNERCRLANDGVSSADGFLLQEKPRPPAADFFLRGKDQKQRLRQPERVP